MARSVFAGVAVFVVVLGSAPGVQAQLPPLDDVTDPIEGTIDQLDDTVDQVEETVEQTVDDTVDQVEETVDEVANTTTDSVGEVGGTVGHTAEETSATLQGSDATAAVSGSGGSATTATGAGDTGDTGGSQEQSQGGARDGRAGRDRAGPEDRAATSAGEARMARLVSLGVATPAVYLPLQVHLTNDADGDGSYRDAESAPEPKADVPFRVRLENLGPGELDITGVRNATPGPFGSETETVCSYLIGTRLAPGGSAACRFTAEALAPPGGQRVVAVIEVDVVETADPSTVATVTDTSVVRTGAVGVLGAVARRILDSLATTGGRISLLLVLAVGLGVAGAWMRRMGNQHGRGMPAASLTVRVPVPGRGPGQRPSRQRSTARPRPSLSGHTTVRRGVGSGRPTR
jgi:hypothetical protein